MDTISRTPSMTEKLSIEDTCNPVLESYIRELEARDTIPCPPPVADEFDKDDDFPF